MYRGSVYSCDCCGAPMIGDIWGDDVRTIILEKKNRKRHEYQLCKRCFKAMDKAFDDAWNARQTEVKSR